MSDIAKNYIQVLDQIKSNIKTAQIKASLSVNQEMLILYWNIGRLILDQQNKEKWGAGIVRALSKDLQVEFSSMKGLSYTNLRYMQRFAKTYPDLLCQEPLGKLGHPILNITWYHNLALLEKAKTNEQRLWYAKKTIENGWSRNVLAIQIEGQAYDRQALDQKKIHNFDVALPDPQSDLATQILKNEYNFEFLTISKKHKEKELEDALVSNIIKFLLELGKGFAFVGQQYHIEVDGDDFYIDLLFYHIKLKSYIVIELKTGKFKPEYVGKLGFYLSCVDADLRDETDNNSIGIILCQSENKAVKDRSVQLLTKPVGVSTYKITKDIPKELKSLENIKKLL